MNTAFNFYISTVRDFVFCRAHFIAAVDTISNNSVNRADTGNIVSCAYTFAQKSIPNLPSEHSRICSLVVRDLIYDGTCCYLGLASTDNTRPNGASLVESAQNLAHTAVRNPQLSRYVTWPHSTLSQLNNSLSNNIR